MSDFYLIDGYNLIHALGLIQRRVAEGELETARRRLLEFLVKSFAADAGRVTVVFDAKQAPRGVKRQQVFHGLHVDFAPKKLSADDRIEELIEQAREPRRLVVISNDGRIQNAAKRRRAQSWTHEDLLDFIDKKRVGTKQEVPPQGDAESPDLTTEEMKRWLTEFADVEDDPELREFFDHDRFK